MARRSQKLPWSSGRGLFAYLARRVPGAAPDSQPNFAWQQVEQTYGEPVPPDVRNSLIVATHLFILTEEAERKADRVTDAQREIEALERDASKLQATLIRASESDAGVVAIDLIERNIDERHLGASFYNSFRALLAALPDACTAARQTLNELPSSKEGDEWSEWVRRITKILKDAGLPWQVSKDWRGKKSPFVALIEALQEHLPEESRRHTHSDGALAKAIVGARSRDE